MPSHHLLQEQQQRPSQLPVGKSKKSSKSEHKLKEKENKERKKKEKKAAKKEKERSASSSTTAASGDKIRKGSRPPAPIPPPQQQIPQKRMIEHHEYQNISEETKIDSKSPVMRMFGDTNFLLNHRRKVSAQGQNGQTQQQPQKESGLSCGQGVCELLNGVYRFSPNVTSFAELESNKSSASTPSLIVGGRKCSSAASSNRSHPSTLDSKEYQNFSVSKYLNIDVKTPNLRKNHVHGHSHANHISSNASSLSTGSSGSNSLNSFDSVEQAIIFQKNKNADSYLGPFNFRQLLRPTQGPTESLRKRKGINPPSPPPLQRGKS